MIRTILFAWACLLLGTPTFSQGQGSPASVAPADCKAVESASACKSFNEMLQSGDEHIKDALDNPRHESYVCFRSDDDIFFLVSFWKPDKDAWLPSKKDSLALTQETKLLFIQYRDGVDDASGIAHFVWQKPSDDGDVTGASQGDASVNSGKVQADVGAAEISLSYSFTNSANSVTEDTIQIRRSTKRFVETFAAKGGKAQFRNTGHCVEY